MTALNMIIEIEETGAKINRSLETDGYTFGALGGFSLGIPMGTGSIVLDARLCYDINPSKTKVNEENNNFMMRRFGSLSLGYMLHL